MTRDERAAKRAQRLKDDIAAKGQELAQVEAQQRADARAKRDRRRQRVGTLADHAGLLIWDDTTLAGLFQILATFRETPDPVAVLERLLADTALTALTPTAAGPFCLTSSAESDSSDVSQGGGGVCSPDRGDTIAQLGVSRGEKREVARTGGAEHGPCGLDTHGV
jgi:hypothetical protein